MARAPSSSYPGITRENWPQSDDELAGIAELEDVRFLLGRLVEVIGLDKGLEKLRILEMNFVEQFLNRILMKLMVVVFIFDVE